MYQVIYADPPWAYRNSKTGGSHTSGAAQKYATLTPAEVAAVPVSRLVTSLATLWLWATVPLLPEILWGRASPVPHRHVDDHPGLARQAGSVYRGGEQPALQLGLVVLLDVAARSPMRIARSIVPSGAVKGLQSRHCHGVLHFRPSVTRFTSGGANACSRPQAK